MRHNFPYTNFHDLNLDWILAKVNEWDALIKQKLIEIGKAVVTANTASQSVAVAVEQAAQANLNAETAKNTANDALTTAREGATAAAESAEASATSAAAAAASAEAAEDSAGTSAGKATAAEASAAAAAASAKAAEDSAGTSASKATAAEARAAAAETSAAAAAASAKAAEEAAEKAASGSGGGGGYNINDGETVTNIKYFDKDVYVKRLSLGYHVDVDSDIFRIPYTGVEAFLKIDILREEAYSAFSGLHPTNITPSGYANGNLTVDIAEGVAEGSYYAIIYYTKT